jgi:hypothetical protein
MTELVTSGSVGGMASNGCLYPEVATRLFCARVWCKYSNELYDIVINQYYG